jgi:carbohydrate-binding DOMON domain-containing protein
MEIEHKPLKLAVLVLELCKAKQLVGHIKSKLRYLWDSGLIASKNISPIALTYFDDLAEKIAPIIVLMTYYKKWIFQEPFFAAHKIAFKPAVNLSFEATYQELLNKLIDWVHYTSAEHNEYLENLDDLNYRFTVVLNSFFSIFRNNKIYPYEELAELSHVAVEDLSGYLDTLLKRR